MYLHENPLHCNCEEFKAWLRSMGVTYTEYIYCDYNSMWLSIQKIDQLRTLFNVDQCIKLTTNRYPYECISVIKQRQNIKLDLVSSLELCFSLVCQLLYVNIDGTLQGLSLYILDSDVLVAAENLILV